MNQKENETIWTKNDEGSHYPVMREWWTFETIFTTKSDGRKWNLLLTISYNIEKPNCFFQYTLFDIKNDTCVIREDINDDLTRLTHQKNKLGLRYKKNTAKGLFPKYSIHLENKKKNFELDFDLHAQCPPHWVAQDVTNGLLPMGINLYKYGFIPNLKLSGNLIINNDVLELEGKGYFEHVWGNWSYQHPFSQIKNIKRMIETYAKLSAWWLSNHQLKIPNTIALTTENNIFGYDWAWGVFTNDWSLFYGNILFWLYKGPSFGTLIINQGGKEYWDFSDVTFNYNNVHYVKEYDIYFATDMDLIARLQNKKIFLRFTLDTHFFKYIDPFDHDGFYKSFILAEMPGKMNGAYYEHEEKKMRLEGDCKLMPLRIPSKLGHNALTINFLKPPRGLGMDFDFNSHYFKKRINGKVHLFPKPRCSIQASKLTKNTFSF